MGLKASKEKEKQKTAKALQSLNTSAVAPVVSTQVPKCCHIRRVQAHPNVIISHGLGTLANLPVEIVATIVLYLSTHEIVHSVGLTCYSGWFVVFQQSIVDVFVHLWHRELSSRALPAGDVSCIPCAFLTEYQIEMPIRCITLRLSQLQKMKSDRDALYQETIRHYINILKLTQWVEFAFFVGIFYETLSWSWRFANESAWFVHQSVFSWGGSCQVRRPYTIFDVSEYILLILWGFIFRHLPTPVGTRRKRFLLIHGGIGAAFLLFVCASCYVPLSFALSASKLVWFIPTVFSITLALGCHVAILIGSACVCSYAGDKIFHFFVNLFLLLKASETSSKPLNLSAFQSVVQWFQMYTITAAANWQQDVKEIESEISHLKADLQKWEVLRRRTMI